MDEWMDGWILFFRYLYIFPNNILSSCPNVETHKEPTPNVRSKMQVKFTTPNNQTSYFLAPF
jgi:hypothetical protein